MAKMPVRDVDEDLNLVIEPTTKTEEGDLNDGDVDFENLRDELMGDVPIYNIWLKR